MLRVFIISSYLMFSYGLQSLLQDADVMIIGQESNTETALSKIQRLDPDLVLYDETVPNSESDLNIMPLLREKPDLKVVGLNLHSNSIHIYQAQEHPIPGKKDIEGITDLVNVIQNEIQT